MLDVFSSLCTKWRYVEARPAFGELGSNKLRFYHALRQYITFRRAERETNGNEQICTVQIHEHCIICMLHVPPANLHFCQVVEDCEAHSDRFFSAGLHKCRPSDNVRLEQNSMLTSLSFAVSGNLDLERLNGDVRHACGPITSRDVGCAQPRPACSLNCTIHQHLRIWPL